MSLTYRNVKPPSLTIRDLWIVQCHSPGLCDVLHQNRGYPAVGNGVPVDSVICTVLQQEPELKVEVQHVHIIGVRQSAAVEVGFDHIETQLRTFVLHLGSRQRSELQEIITDKMLGRLLGVQRFLFSCRASIFKKSDPSLLILADIDF